MCGKATLAMAVSSSSMKVASVTATAMIQGLIAGRSVMAWAAEMVAVAVLISVPTPVDATRDQPVPSNIWYDATSDQSVAPYNWRQGGIFGRGSHPDSQLSPRPD